MSNVLPESVNNILNSISADNTSNNESSAKTTSAYLNKILPSNTKSSASKMSKLLKNNMTPKVKYDNLTNSKKMRELLDSLMASNIDIDTRNRLLYVIKSSLENTQKQEDKALDTFANKYGLPMPPQPQPQQYQPPYYNMQQPPAYGMYPPPPAYGMYGMPQQQLSNPMYGMPQPMYGMPQQQQPVAYDMLFNKMNMIQMEMADLTRHLRDYTRRYMDNMRESDMDQIKNYIDGLMDTIPDIQQEQQKTLPEAGDDNTEPGLIDKATSTLKNGLSTVTNTVNSIGSKLGLTNDNIADKPATKPNNTPTSNTPTSNKSVDDNMMSLEDYENDTKLNDVPEDNLLDNELEDITEAEQDAINAKEAQPATATAQQKPDELGTAITELNKQGNKKQGVPQQGGRFKSKKQDSSLLESFTKMMGIKKQSKKQKNKGAY